MKVSFKERLWLDMILYGNAYVHITKEKGVQRLDPREVEILRKC